MKDTKLACSIFASPNLCYVSLLSSHIIQQSKFHYLKAPKKFFSYKIGLFFFLQTVLEFREQQWVVFLRSIFFIVRYSKYQVYDFVNSRTQLITPDLGFAQNTNCFFLLKGSRWELRSVNASNIETLWYVGAAQTVSLRHRVRGLMSWGAPDGLK